MRIAVVGHSLAHIRQQNFFRQLTLMGHDVLLICPERWGTLQPKADKIGIQGEAFSTYEICPLPIIGGTETGSWDMYTFRLVGLDRVIEAWKPEWVYIQQEVACQLTRQAWDAAQVVHARTALFVWENIHPAVDSAFRLLHGFDLVVCGNDVAARLHPHPRQVFLPQVGVDADHFAPRSEIERTVDVGYIGRPVMEKGIHDLETAWPATKITPWTEWTKLPWALSGIRVIACPSRDTAFWHEQAGPYAAWEAMACGCSAVVSDAGAIPWWNKGGYCPPCETLLMVKQGDVGSLRTGIMEALSDWEARGKANRLWVQEHFGLLVVAKQLVHALATA